MRAALEIGALLGVAAWAASGCFSRPSEPFEAQPPPAAAAACSGEACGDGGAADADTDVTSSAQAGGGGVLLDASALAVCPGVDLDQAPKLPSVGDGTLLAAGFAQRTTVSADGARWESDRHVVADAGEPEETFYSVALGAGPIVAAVGGGIMTSDDGRSWTKRPVADVRQYVRYDNGFYAALYAKGRYIVAASARFNDLAFYSSTDGLTWGTPVVPNSVDCCRPIYAMATNGDRIVAVGAGRRSIVSDDGMAWHDERLPIDPSTIDAAIQEGKRYGDDVGYASIAFGNGVFVAVGARSIIARSTNGVDWTDAAPGKPIGDFRSVLFDGSKFLTCARTGCYSSTDGATWTAPAGALLTDPRPARALLKQGDLYLGLDVPARILTSKDGMTWTPVFCGAPPQLTTLAFLPGR